VSNADRIALQQQVGCLALAVSQLCLIVVDLGRQAGFPAPSELVHAVSAARAYAERLLRA
jgi:hypothetical protein